MGMSWTDRTATLPLGGRSRRSGERVQLGDVPLGCRQAVGGVEQFGDLVPIRSRCRGRCRSSRKARGTPGCRRDHLPGVPDGHRVRAERPTIAGAAPRRHRPSAIRRSRRTPSWCETPDARARPSLHCREVRRTGHGHASERGRRRRTSVDAPWPRSVATHAPAVRQRRNQLFFDTAVPAAEHWQRSSCGTWPSTCSTWAPHPAQLGRPQVLQEVCLHIPQRVYGPTCRRNPAITHRATGSPSRSVPRRRCRCSVAEPPDAVASASTIARPRPVPGLDVSPRQNRRIASRLSCVGQPGPVVDDGHRRRRRQLRQASRSPSRRRRHQQRVVEHVVEDLFDRAGHRPDDDRVAVADSAR